MQPIKHPRAKRKLRPGIAVSLAVALLAVGGLYYRQARPVAAPARASTAVPVTVTTATSRDVTIYRDALGTVSASNTVSIRAQITGTLQSVNFTEGQDVHQGDTLAVIDPRPLQAALAQAVGRKAQDQAQLISAQKDLARYAELAKRDYAT